MLSQARRFLYDDKDLADWFNYWQIGREEKKPVTSAEIQELKRLLGDTTLEVGKLRAVATIITKVDGEGPVSEAWIKEVETRLAGGRR